MTHFEELFSAVQTRVASGKLYYLQRVDVMGASIGEPILHVSKGSEALLKILGVNITETHLSDPVVLTHSLRVCMGSEEKFQEAMEGIQTHTTRNTTLYSVGKVLGRIR